MDFARFVMYYNCFKRPLLTTLLHSFVTVFKTEIQCSKFGELQISRDSISQKKKEKLTFRNILPQNICSLRPSGNFYTKKVSLVVETRTHVTRLESQHLEGSGRGRVLG